MAVTGASGIPGSSHGAIFHSSGTGVTHHGPLKRYHLVSHASPSEQGVTNTEVAGLWLGSVFG